MLFSSLTFLMVFLPCTLALYYVVPDRFKNMIMLIASLIFYAWGEPVYIILMMLSIALNYVCGINLGEKEDDPAAKKKSLIFAVVINLLILGFFKYYGFFVESINSILPVDLPYKELPLPIGISFYTFQAVSYIVDVYRGNAKVQRNFLNFALYICMFPQLIAGPIVRYVDIEIQLRKRELSINKFGNGVKIFIIGLAKKVVLANCTGAIFNEIIGLQMGSFSVLTAWVGCISYAFQIYFDFSGYSDMAVGLGRMFGFEFRKNFDYPYVSKSITEFWRRWHISLSTWFKEYVYIPLGGNRFGKARQIENILIVWMLTGMWHGAAWNFIFWGLYYGILLILEKFVWGDKIQKLPEFFQHLYAIIGILIGWVFFFSPNVGYAFDYIGTMFGIGGSGVFDGQGFFFLFSNYLLYVIAVLGSCAFGAELLNTIARRIRNGKVRTLVIGISYIVLLFVTLAYLVTESFNPFLYFRF